MRERENGREWEQRNDWTFRSRMPSENKLFVEGFLASVWMQRMAKDGKIMKPEVGREETPQRMAKDDDDGDCKG